MSRTYRFGGARTRLVPFLLLLPGMVLYLAIALGPSLATAAYSFTDATGLPGSPVNWVGLANYHEFLALGTAARDNLDAVAKTLLFCVVVTVVQTTLGLLVAVSVNRRLRGTAFFRALFFLPVILGATIQGLVWTLFLYPLGGPAQRILALFGARSEFLGGPPMNAFTWVMWVQIWSNLGITMIVFLSGLQTIPAELEESARLDGAAGWAVFRHVTYPLLTPSLNTNLILAIIGSLQAWQLLLIMKGVTNGAQVLGLRVYAIAFGRLSANPTSVAMRQGYGAAASIVLFLMVLAIGLAVQYLLRRRERRLLG